MITKASSMLGRLRRRLLLNALVDPEEAAGRLPAGLSPYVLPGGSEMDGTVVGCCLVEIEALRPSWAPRAVGHTVFAAAHRISISGGRDADGEPVPAVFVPVRHSSSRVAVVAGGRVVPGVHRAARIERTAGERALSWSVDEVGDGAMPFRLRARVTHAGSLQAIDHPVGRATIGASLGLSPTRRSGALEAVRMHLSDHRAIPVHVDALSSAFLSSFRTARPAPSFLMTDVDVRWCGATAPSASSRPPLVRDAPSPVPA